ncbi:MAG: trigger factor [Candidatus Binatia bacterium]
MQVSVEEVNTTRRKLAVEVPVEQVSSEIDRAFGRVQQHAHIKGFRQGRVPRAILEKYFGEQVRAEVLSHLIEHSFADAIQQSGLRPVGNPEIVPESIAPGSPLRYQATVDVLPEIRIAEASGIAAKRPVREVVDADVERALTDVRESLAELRPIEDRTQPARGDFAVLDYSAKLEGEEAGEPRKENRMVEVGANAMPPEIDLALQSMSVGQTRTVGVTYPTEGADAKVAGKTVEFEIVLRGLREKVLPPIDDDLAREHGDAETLDELRAKLRERISASVRHAAEEQVRDQLVDALLEKNAFDVPKSMIDRQTESLANDLFRNARGADALRGDEAAMTKLKDELRPRAERQVRAALALETLAKQENIEVTDNDVDARVETLAAQAGEHAERLRAAYRKEEVREELQARLVRERALEWIVEHAAIEDVVVPADVVAPPDATR